VLDEDSSVVKTRGVSVIGWLSGPNKSRRTGSTVKPLNRYCTSTEAHLEPIRTIQNE
jgi:hypothetical protein